MAISRKYIVTQDKESKEITYKEYEPSKGFNVKPNNNFKFGDMIDVKEMVIINPSLIDKLVHKKCERTMERLIKLLALIYEEDDDGDNGAMELALNEETKFRTLLITKYKAYLKEEEYKVYLEKLEILKTEIMLKKQALFEEQYEKKGKSSR